MRSRSARVCTWWLWVALALMPLRGLAAVTMSPGIGGASPAQFEPPCHAANPLVADADVADADVAEADGVREEAALGAPTDGPSCGWCDLCHAATHGLAHVPAIAMDFAPPRVAATLATWRSCTRAPRVRPPSP